MTQALLVRHAQSEWNASSRWQGWADPPLSELGRAQARQAGERLARLAEPFTYAVSSDLDRARSTAGILVERAGSAELRARQPRVEEVPDLRELDVGLWSGLTRAEIAAKWPDEFAGWGNKELDAAPGGESGDAFDARVRGALVQILASHPADRLLVVAHGGVIRSVGRWLGASEITGHHVAGFWLEHDGAGLAITEVVDLLSEADAVPDDSAGAL